nr:MAG TPA: hypothetical protein [Caudoviricetes sp.]
MYGSSSFRTNRYKCYHGYLPVCSGFSLLLSLSFFRTSVRLR